MKNVTLYQVDAFADKLFAGNPAAVCPLDTWLSDRLLQYIAIENNLSETAFIVDEGDHLRLRWFTPGGEVELCGHATLATAYVFFHELGFEGDTISFMSLSGMLHVTRNGDKLTLDFPQNPAVVVEDTISLLDALGISGKEVRKAKTDYLVILNNQEELAALQPDFRAIKVLGARGVICTALGTDVDFVSRFFAPAMGIDEDPVTGSAHTTLTPYWSERLGKSELTARQISPRGGYLELKQTADRVNITGTAVLYLRGNILLPQ